MATIRGKRVNIKGLKDAMALLQRVGGKDAIDEIEAVFAEAVKPVEDEYERRARAIALPKPHRLIWKKFGMNRLLKPGTLAESAHSRASRHKHPRAFAAVTGKLGGPQARFVEFGTSRARPKPIFRQSINAKRAAVKDMAIVGIGRIYQRLLLSPRVGE